MNPEKEPKNSAEQSAHEYLPPEKVRQYVAETDRALQVILNVMKRGKKDFDSESYIPWSKEELKKDLNTLYEFTRAKKIYFEEGQDPKSANHMQEQMDLIDTYLKNSNADENTYKELLDNIEPTLQPNLDQEDVSSLEQNKDQVFSSAIGQQDEELPYEDSIEKAERLKNEFIKLHTEYEEMVEVLERDVAKQYENIAEIFELINQSAKESEVDPKSLNNQEIIEQILKLKIITLKQEKLKENVIGLRGDINGDLAVLKNQENKIKKVVAQLRELGEI